MQNLESDKKIELLSPAGSPSSLIAAVSYGADAVYLGLDEFNARINADNFTLNNIGEWIKYCHLFGVKVYLTVNIIIFDSEMTRALKMIEQAYNLGIDAVIIQDLGLFNMVRKYLPFVRVHCSTQMGIHNYLGAKYAYEHGASRIVLSRETSLKDIKEIKSKVDIEIEYFVQGALCVCFSGNCYYSSLVSSNSGNRGRCLQLCRKKYTAQLGDDNYKEMHYLSPSDLSLVNRLNDLREAGVDSIKIEGRMKRPEYVAQATKTYRYALDHGAANDDDIQKLMQMFNRGGCNDGYIDNKKNYGNLIHPKHPAHSGVFIGKVSKITPMSAEVSTSYKINSGDGFKIFRNDEEVGNAVGQDGYLKYRGNIKIGDSVHITTSTKTINELDIKPKKLPIEITCNAYANQPVSLKLKYKTTEVSYTADYLVECAKLSPIQKEDIRENLSRLGNTNFTAADIIIDSDEEIFIPKSVLNDIRRKGISLLEQAILMSNGYFPANGIEQIPDRLPKNIYNSNIPKDTQKLMVQVSKYELLNDDMGIDCLIYNPYDYSQLQTKPDISTPVYLNLPLIALADDLEILKKQKNILKTYDGIVANNIYGFEFAKELDTKLILGTGLNIANHYLDASDNIVIASAESEDMFDSFLYTYGHMALMTIKVCPYSAIKRSKDVSQNVSQYCANCPSDNYLSIIDDKNKKLNIRRVVIKNCQFQLLDNEPLMLPPRKRNNLVFLDLTDYNKSRVMEVISNAKSDTLSAERYNYFRDISQH